MKKYERTALTIVLTIMFTLALVLVSRYGCSNGPCQLPKVELTPGLFSER